MMIQSMQQGWRVAKLKRGLKKLKQVHAQEVAELRKSGPINKLYKLEQEHHFFEQEYYEELESIESTSLVNKAKQLLIKVPHYEAWETGTYGERYLPYDIRAALHTDIRLREKLNAEIMKETRDSWFKWITIIIAIIVAITGIYVAYQNKIFQDQSLRNGMESLQKSQIDHSAKK